MSSNLSIAYDYINLSYSKNLLKVIVIIEVIDNDIKKWWYMGY